MESLDEHFASIAKTIHSSTQLIEATFASCAEMRVVAEIQRTDVRKMRAGLAAMTDPFALPTTTARRALG